MDFGGTTAFQPYGDTWRKHRTLYNEQLHSAAIAQFESLQVNSVKDLLRILLDSPENVVGHLRQYVPSHYFSNLSHGYRNNSMAAKIVVNFTYGYEIQAVNDPLVKFIESNLVAFFKATRPGAYLVDSFPIRVSLLFELQGSLTWTCLVKYIPAWFPGAGFKKEAKEVRARVNQTRDVPFRDVKHQLVRLSSLSPFWKS